MFILSLIFIFIIRLRFRNKSTIEILRNRYGKLGVHTFRKLEKLDLKLRKLECDLEFLTCCHTNHLTPKFLNFKLSLSKFNGNDDYRKFQRRLLEKEIEEKRKQILSNDETFQEYFTKLQNICSALDFNHFKNIIINNNIRKTEDFKIKHNRKLFGLGLQVKYDQLAPDEIIFNCTDLKLSLTEKEALSLGLEYCFRPNKLDHTKFFLSFEKVLQKLSSHQIYSCIPDALGVVKANLKSIAFKIYYNFRPNISAHQARLVSALKKLSKNKTIHITKPDKSRGVVLMNKSDYITRMDNILNDHTKFKKITEDTYKILLRNEDKNNRLVTQLFNKGIICEDEKKTLYSSGSIPGSMYGLPKMHKPNFPLRPILSSIGTSNYKCSKYLVSVLKDCINKENIVRDSFDFSREISCVPSGGLIMSSFDICSLFTNIPVDETCKIILEKLFPHKNSKFQGFDRLLFGKLLDNCCKNNIFLFNNELYSQIEGAPMGGCVSPILADIFLSHYEKIWLNECPNSFRPVYYKRYVDDTFLLFRETTHVKKFYDYINSKHPQIKFSYEIETNSQISFLDVLVRRDSSGFTTDVYRKPSNTGLGMKFHSEVPTGYKINLIHCLCVRAFNICSSYNIFMHEIEHIKKFFVRNGFPLKTVESNITKRLEILKNPPQIEFTVPRKLLFFTFPYITNRINNSINSEIVSLCRAFYPQISPKIIFKNSFSVKSFFRSKDKIPNLLQSNLVYSYNCGQCDATYYGETTRHLKTRIAEHKGLSNRTNKPLSNPSHSSIRDHVIETGHDMNSNSFKIVFKCNKYDLKTSESIIIYKNRPNLNNMESSTSLSILG